MKNVFKVLFALFLINSAGLCGAQQDDTVPWYNRIGSFVNRNFLNEDEQAEDAVGGVDVDQDNLCYLCWGEFTEENPVYKRLMNNTCMHQKLHKKCSSNEVCFDDECCLHAAIRNWRENYNGWIQCPSRCRSTKIDNVSELLPMLLTLSREERLAEKKRLLLVKAGRILRVGTYSAMFIQNCREKDAFDRAMKMLMLSTLMFGDRIIEKALNTIRASGVTTLKDKVAIIMQEFLKNIFRF
ncbi:hypothetical protein EBU24_05330, partial [bacterium]|nr:hypothetical protein [bacterium]